MQHKGATTRRHQQIVGVGLVGEITMPLVARIATARTTGIWLCVNFALPTPVPTASLLRRKVYVNVWLEVVAKATLTVVAKATLTVVAKATLTVVTTATLTVVAKATLTVVTTATSQKMRNRKVYVIIEMIDRLDSTHVRCNVL